MSSAHDLATSRSEKKATGIYIARGADTLGPYNPAEAEALVVGGYLHVDDYAACNGDSAWVPLAEFLPPSFCERQTAPGRKEPARAALPPPGTPLLRWQRLAALFVLLAAGALLIAGGVRWSEGRRPARPPVASPAPMPIPATTTPPTLAPALVVASTPVAGTPTPTTPPPTPEPDGPLRGSLAVPRAGVQIAAYPLDALETALAPVAEAALIARQHLDPPVVAAAAEHAARAAEEKAALQALNDAAPNDPLRPSLRFAYNGAKTATRTAADNERFLLEERAGLVGGEVYFRALPAPALTTETDDAGSFKLDLPPGGPSYVVAATVRQTADDGRVRTLRWLVRPSPAQRTGHAPLRLDETNALTSASEDSVVQTVD